MARLKEVRSIIKEGSIIHLILRRSLSPERISQIEDYYCLGGRIQVIINTIGAY